MEELFLDSFLTYKIGVAIYFFKVMLVTVSHCQTVAAVLLFYKLSHIGCP